MFKGKMLIGIILTILLVFSINGFTEYYKYTQESGTNFYVGTDDKSDALEDTNEVRQILDDLGNLLGHSLRNDIYPKDGPTGGYLGRLNYGVDASKPAVPVINDLYLATDTTKIYRCFVAGNWVEVYPGAAGVTTFLELTDTPANYTGGSLKFTRVNIGETALEFAAEADPNVDTDAEIKSILVDEITKTGDFTAGRIAKINNATGIIEQGTNTDADVADAVTKKHTQNTDTALGTQTQDLNMGTHKIIGVVDPVNPQEAATKAYADTKVATEVDPTVDSDAEIKSILVDEITKTGDFTAGRIAKINNATGIIEQGTNTDADVADAVTKKHTQNTDTDLDATFEATLAKSGANTDITSLGGLTTNIAIADGGTGQSSAQDAINALTDVGCSPPETVLTHDPATGNAMFKEIGTVTNLDFTKALTSDHTYSGELDTWQVGESVVFGDLLYFNWATKKWKKTDADAAATMPGLRIALESKADGETCLMLVKGYIRDDSAFEFAGAMVYASVTPGAVSSTAPTETGDQIQRVGVGGSSKDILFFDPSIDVGEI